MTGYGMKEYLEEVKKAKERRERPVNRPYVCPICGMTLETPDEYHSDECDIFKGFLAWRKQKWIENINKKEDE